MHGPKFEFLETLILKNCVSQIFASPVRVVWGKLLADLKNQ
jgi:hypothetical protein